MKAVLEALFRIEKMIEYKNRQIELKRVDWRAESGPKDERAKRADHGSFLMAPCVPSVLLDLLEEALKCQSGRLETGCRGGKGVAATEAEEEAFRVGWLWADYKKKSPLVKLDFSPTYGIAKSFRTATDFSRDCVQLADRVSSSVSRGSVLCRWSRSVMKEPALLGGCIVGLVVTPIEVMGSAVLG